jgi:hypothetical protein
MGFLEPPLIHLRLFHYVWMEVQVWVIRGCNFFIAIGGCTSNCTA